MFCDEKTARFVFSSLDMINRKQQQKSMLNRSYFKHFRCYILIFLFQLVLNTPAMRVFFIFTIEWKQRKFRLIERERESRKWNSKWSPQCICSVFSKVLTMSSGFLRLVWRREQRKLLIFNEWWLRSEKRFFSRLLNKIERSGWHRFVSAYWNFLQTGRDFYVEEIVK